MSMRCISCRLCFVLCILDKCCIPGGGRAELSIKKRAGSCGPCELFSIAASALQYLYLERQVFFCWFMVSRVGFVTSCLPTTELQKESFISACALKSILMAKWVLFDLPDVFTPGKGQGRHVLVRSQRFLFSTLFLPVCQENCSSFYAVHNASQKAPW